MENKRRIQELIVERNKILANAALFTEQDRAKLTEIQKEISKLENLDAKPKTNTK